MACRILPSSIASVLPSAWCRPYRRRRFAPETEGTIASARDAIVIAVAGLAVLAVVVAGLPAVAQSPPRGAASDAPAAPSRAAVKLRATRLAALGRAIFADPSLSPSRRMACASCHD